MSAQEQQILNLQQQLHAENQRRFEQIEKNQDKQQKMLEELLVNTQGLGQMKLDVDDLKDAHSRLKGASAVGGAILAGWEAIRFLFFRH